MKTYDTHAHLDQLENLESALNNATAAGVKGIVAISMDYASCENLLKIKQSYKEPRIYIAMGMHPSQVNLDNLQKTGELIRNNRHQLHAIGEIGLDFWYKWVRKDEQKKEEQRTA